MASMKSQPPSKMYPHSQLNRHHTLLCACALCLVQAMNRMRCLYQMLKVGNMRSFCRIWDIQKTSDPIAAIFLGVLSETDTKFSAFLRGSIVIAKPQFLLLSFK